MNKKDASPPLLCVNRCHKEVMGFTGSRTEREVTFNIVFSMDCMHINTDKMAKSTCTQAKTLHLKAVLCLVLK